MHVTIDRRVLYLTLVVVLGLCLTQCLQSSRPVGRNVSRLPVLAAILAGADRQKLYMAQLAKLKPFVVRRKTRNYGVSIRHTRQVAPAEHANKEKESSKDFTLKY